MIRILFCIVVLLLCFGAHSAYAVEPFALYDNFTASTIDGAKWAAATTVQKISVGKLFISHRSNGVSGSDTGQESEGRNLHFIDQPAVTAIRAIVTVTQFDITDCTTNKGITKTRARLAGDFFNTGTPTAGSAMNDVYAQIKIERRSDSTEATGVLDVSASLVLCTNSDCTTNTTLPGSKNMGTVTVGTPVTLTMIWDKVNKRFIFKRDTAASVTIAYTVADTGLPGRLNKGVGVNNAIDYCNSIPLSTAFIAATFDNVYVNASAAP
jgi:hypothetical protein